MMGPAFYVMAILGCGEADTACQQVAVASTHYASIEACNAAGADAVARQDDLLFPVVIAQCQPAGGQISEKVMPADVALPEPERQPEQRRISYEAKSARS